MNHLIKNNKGETLMTVLMAAMFLMFVVGIAAPTIVQSYNSNSQVLTPNSTCRDIAQNVLNVIRTDGIQSRYYPTSLRREGTLLNDRSWHGGDYSYNPDGVTTEVTAQSEALSNRRWPNVRAVEWQSGSPPYVSHSPRLIRSAVNGLAAIYNSYNNQVCRSGMMITADNALSSLYVGDSYEGYNFTTSIYIRPYDLVTGDRLNCEYPLNPRPLGKTEPPEAEEPFNLLSFSNYNALRGFEVQIEVVTHPSHLPAGDTSQDSGCGGRERFQFDQIASEPRAPDLNDHGGNGHYTFTNNMGAGTMLFCQSTHRMHTGFSYPSYTPTWSSPVSTGWLPCDRLTVCGDSSGTEFNDAGTALDKTYDIPDNCMAEVEVRAVDAIGNVSDKVASTIYAGQATGGNPSGNDNGGGNPGFEVGGMQFSQVSVAIEAARTMGLQVADVVAIDNLSGIPMDGVVNSSLSGLGGVTAGTAQAQSFASQAAAGLAGAGAAAGASFSSASGARSNATAARSAATATRSAATSARAAATAARSAASAMSATGAGAVSAATKEAAEAAAADAEAAAAEAEAAAAEAERLAAEAEAAAEQAERDEADRDRDNS